MSWLVDAVTSVLNFIGQIVQTIVGFVTFVVDQIHIFLLTLIHTIKKELAKFFADPVYAAIGICILVAAIILLPLGYTVLESAGIIGMVEAIASFVQSGLESFLVFIHFRELLLINDILMIVWEQYRSIITKFYTAIGSLSGDLAYETSFITHAVRNAGSIIANLGILAGVPPEYIMLEQFDKTAQLLQRIEDNFGDYAAHPEKLLKDIDEHIIYPYMKQASDTQNKILEDVAKVYQDLLTTTNNLYNLKKSVDTFVEEMPKEIKDSINIYYNELSESIDNIYDNYVLVIDDKVNKIGDRVEEYNKLVTRDIDILESRQNKIASNLLDLAIEDVDEFKKQLKGLGCMIITGIQLKCEEFFVERGKIDWNKQKQMMLSTIHDKAPKVLQYETPYVYTTTDVNVNTPKNWNQGEY